VDEALAANPVVVDAAEAVAFAPLAVLVMDAVAR
jgi:hypothetical protein